MKLKSCPFCGGEVYLASPQPPLYRPSRNGKYCIICNNCCLFFGWDNDYGCQFDSKKEITEKWNERV